MCGWARALLESLDSRTIQYIKPLTLVDSDSCGCVCVQERETKRGLMCVCVCVCAWLLHSIDLVCVCVWVCVCVCVCMCTCGLNFTIREQKAESRELSQSVRWSYQAFPVTEVIRWPEMTLTALEEWRDGVSAKSAVSYRMTGKKDKNKTTTTKHIKGDDWGKVLIQKWKDNISKVE